MTACMQTHEYMYDCDKVKKHELLNRGPACASLVNIPNPVRTITDLETM